MAKKINYAGMFTLRKDGRYQASYVDESGDRKYLYDRDAEALYNKLKAAQEPKPLTFKEIAERWQEHHAEIVTFNASAIYNAPLKQLIELWGDLPAGDLSPAMVQSLLNSMAKQGYARRTVQVRLNALNQIYDKAIVDGVVQVNPCAGVRMPTGLKTEKRELPEECEIEMVKGCYNLPFGMFAYFILYSGLRRGELLALKWEDIDFKRRIINVRRSMYWEVNQPVIKDTKTSAGQRTVPLLTPLEEKLIQKGRGKGYIFGLPTQTVYRRKWAKYQNDAWITLTPHQLRHAFATVCFEAGLDEKDAQQILGHSSIQVTKDIYIHIREQRRQQTADRLNSYVVNGDVKKPVGIDNTAQLHASHA